MNMEFAVFAVRTQQDNKRACLNAEHREKMRVQEIYCRGAEEWVIATPIVSAK